MSKSEATVGGLAVGLVRARSAAAEGLRAALTGQGVRVVLDESLSRFAHGLRWQQSQVDALLLDLERADEAELALLEDVLDRVTLPLVFHDGQIRANDEVWLQRLIDKIEAAVAAHARANADRLSTAATADLSALRCWVLGASFGGPEALKRFLSAMPAPPPATAFIIGQHIGDGFVEVLAAQLSRSTAFKVAPAVDGAVLESGHVYVAPVQEQLRLDADGRLRLERNAKPQLYLPSIDHLMTEVAQSFGRRSGAIIFSGMGDDGARGSVAIARAGGPVWVQAADSCACDSMPNCAKATGAVSREGTPEQLASHLAEFLSATAAVARSRTA